MRVFAAVFLVCACLVLIVMPGGIFADSINTEDTCHPVVHKTCGPGCENSCDEPDAESRPCDQVGCVEGYFCKPGYVREFKNSRFDYRCILPSECPPKSTVAPDPSK